MQEVQSQDAHFVGEVFELDRQALPQMYPGIQVPVAQLGEPAESAQPPLGIDSGFGRRDIAPGEEGHHLLYRQHITEGQLDRDIVPDFCCLVDQAVGGRHGSPVTPHDASRRHSDGNARLGRLNRQQHRVVIDLPLFHQPEMIVGQVPIPLDERVRDVAVQRRANLDCP